MRGPNGLAKDSEDLHPRGDQRSIGKADPIPKRHSFRVEKTIRPSPQVPLGTKRPVVRLASGRMRLKKSPSDGGVFENPTNQFARLWMRKTNTDRVRWTWRSWCATLSKREERAAGRQRPCSDTWKDRSSHVKTFEAAGAGLGPRQQGGESGEGPCGPRKESLRKPVRGHEGPQRSGKNYGKSAK